MIDESKFEMLKKPRKLKPNSKMPCLIRLIQDKSPIGLYHQDLYSYDSRLLKPFVCAKVRSLKDKADSNRGSVVREDGILSLQYYHFEIVGFLKKEI